MKKSNNLRYAYMWNKRNSKTNENSKELFETINQPSPSMWLREKRWKWSHFFLQNDIVWRNGEGPRLQVYFVSKKCWKVSRSLFWETSLPKYVRAKLVNRRLFSSTQWTIFNQQGPPMKSSPLPHTHLHEVWKRSVHRK